MSSAAVGAGSVLSGRYRLVEPLASGGMGTVWRALDLLLDRPVAVKEVRLPPGLDDDDRKLLRRRTIREAQVAARLRHAAIVTIFDVVEQDGRPWIVMELVPSRSLAEIVRTHGPLPPVRVAGIGLRVLDAMVAATVAGVEHRDIKPANVLVTDEGRVVLTDFGIARHVGDETLTAAGLLIGSPDYLAPERARGRSGGLAADLWSLGATMYDAVEGRRPFERNGPLPTLAAVVMDEPEPPLRAGPLRPVIDGLLVKDPAHRLDADRTRAMLERVVRGRSAGATLPLPRPAGDAVPASTAVDHAPAPAPTADRPKRTVSGTAADADTAADANTTADAAPDAHTIADSNTAVDTHTAAAAAIGAAAGAAPAEAAAAATGAAGRTETAADDAEATGAGSRGAEAVGAGGGRTSAAARPPAGSPRRRRVALAATVLLVLAGVAAVLIQTLGSGGADPPGGPAAGAPPTTQVSASEPHASASTEPTTTGPARTAGPPSGSPAPPATGAQLAAPAGFTRYTDPRDGFSVIVPAGWLPVRRDTRVDFDDPGSSRFLRIDTSDTPLADPYQNWVDYERQFRQGRSGYRLIGIRRVADYRPSEGWTTADWEFLLGGTHVLDRNIRVSSARAHAIYWSTPDSQWNAAISRRALDLAERSFVPAPTGG